MSRCTCGCRAHVTDQSESRLTNNDKMSENDSDITGVNFDKRVDVGDDIDMPNGASHSLVDLLGRDNKDLLQRNRELEKQIQMLRSSGPRLPTRAVGYAMGFDAHSGGQIFTNGLSTQCPLYGTMTVSLQSEVFDAEKGIQVQLIPNYNVWVSKSKLQFIVKEAGTQKEGAPLFVLRRLIPLVFAWEELAASRGQGLNCKSTDDVVNKEPLDPTKVLVCKAFMRKFCMENGHAEPLEKHVNETFSHQVNYARRKFKSRTTKQPDGLHGDPSDQNDSFGQSQCVDGTQQ